MNHGGCGIYDGEMREADTGKTKSTLYCSFCGKSQHEVNKLVAGPGVCICNECIELSQAVIHDNSQGAKKKIAHINLWINRHIKNWEEVDITAAELLKLAFDISLKDSLYGEMSVEEMLVKLEEVISCIIYDKLGLKEIDIEIQQMQEALDTLKSRREDLLLGK